VPVRTAAANSARVRPNAPAVACGLLGSEPRQLATATRGSVSDPTSNALCAALAAPEGIWANVSIFDRADLLGAMVDQPLHTPMGTTHNRSSPRPPGSRGIVQDLWTGRAR
jgi:hypothetical protein